jgi:hypothetical protein
MRGYCAILLIGLGCGPATDSTQSGSSEGTAETGASTSTSTPTPTTGEAACEAPAGEPIEVLIFNQGAIVVGAGSLTCSDEGLLKACDCVAETIDRLVIESALEVGTREFTAEDGPERIECAMGDDGCSSTETAGTLTIVRADAGCVAGTLDFGSAGAGSFAAAPCA